MVKSKFSPVFVGILYLFSVFCLYFCKEEKPHNEQTDVSALKGDAHEGSDDEIATLYSNYITEPNNQKDIDQNIIIDYAATTYPDVQYGESGLFYKIIEKGTSAKYTYGSEVKAYYKGYFTNGDIFDSNLSNKKPAVFKIGSVIDGWNEGLQLLSPGSKAIFMVPSHLAYGSKGILNKVPANAVLIFEIETLQ